MTSVNRKYGACPGFPAVPGSRLNQARKETGLTQVEVSRLLVGPPSLDSNCESSAQRADSVELQFFAKVGAEKPVMGPMARGILWLLATPRSKQRRVNIS
jgi:hypothetical protein